MIPLQIGLRDSGRPPTRSWEWFIIPRVALIVVLALFLGCSSPRQGPLTATDSTGMITGGHRSGEFVHGSPPYYGSVVYLIPVTPSSEDWWVRLARPRYALVDPQRDRSLGFVDRTTEDPAGRFQFKGVRPGDYYLYARVLWTATIGDSTLFGGGAWVGTATVAPRETTRVVLVPPTMKFQSGAPPRRFPQPLHPTDPDLPRFGEYVYVQELPEVTKRIPPEYPLDARRAGVDGTVMVQALVGKDGRVKNTRVVKSIPMLDEAAVAAVRKWVFKPAATNNKAVAYWVAVPVRFAQQAQ